MEQKLKELLELNQKIINSSYMGIAVYNADSGLCVLANNSLASMVGGNQDELLKQNFRNLDSWKKSGMDKMAEKALATGKEISNIFYIETTFNKKIYLECTFSSFTSNGEEHLLFIASDITGKKLIENKLIESEKKYRHLIELAQEGVWVIDSEGYTTFVNPCMAEMLGYTGEEMTGKHIFCFIDERHISIARNRLERRRQGVKEQHEFELRGKDGKRIYTIMSSSPVIDEEGNYNGAITLVKDITERKTMENSLNINNQIASVFLTSDSYEMYGEILEIILKVLNSEYGLFGFINERGDFVCPSMTRDIWDKCRTADKNIIFPKEKWGGIWGRSLMERKTLYSNESFNVPSGHIPLTNALIVPVLYQEKLIGLVGVANRKEGYKDFDAGLLESIVEFIAPVLKARLDSDRFEKSLIESEEKLNLLIKSMDNMIFQLDKNGIFLSYYTGASDKNNLYVLEDIFIGKSFKRVLPLDVAIKLDEAMKGILSDHKTRSFDYSMKVSSKSRWFNATVSIYKDIKGEYGGFTCVVRDITDRHHAEEALKESEKKYKTLYDSSRDAIMIVKPEKGFINGNHATIELFSCKNEEEFINQSPASLSPEYQPDGKLSSIKALEMMAIAMEKGSHFFEWKHKKLDGKEFFATVLLNRLELYGENLLQATVRDITVYKQAEEALRASEEKYRSLVDNIGTGVVLISRDMEILTLNNQMKLWFPHIDVSAKPVCYKKFNNPPGKHICPYCPAVKTLRDGQVYESIAETPVGEKIMVYRIISSPVIDKDGSIVAAIEMVEDITERKKAENELIEQTMARNVAEAANKAKSEILSNISHELRTPLNSILGYARLLMADEKLTAEQKRGMAIIEKSGVHLLALINDILDISRIEAKKMEILNNPFDLKKMLYMIEHMIKVKIMEKNLSFHFEYDRDLPDYVLGDEKKISQILLNLLGNAVKFTHQGSIGLKVKRMDKKIKFQVEDTGIGIPEDKVDIIFSPFQQLSGHLKKSEGTGLGLAISRELAELMGSKLNVESIIGKGSKFWFEIELISQRPLLTGRDCKEEIITDFDKAFNEQLPDLDEVKLPVEIVKNLFYISEKGDFRAIKKELNRIKSLDKSYEPFYKKVKKLVDGFELERLNKLLESYVGK